MDVVAHLRDWRWPFPVDGPVVVGVSGGVDSMVLAEAMVRLGFSRLVTAHLHHGLRGEAADADEALVRDWAAARGCGCEVGRVAVEALAADRRQSIETAGREARREFLLGVALRHGARHVVLAHHADDQVETLLMHLLRGAGTRGLAAMRVATPWQGLEWVRPLLGVWRRELVAWAIAERLAWREDATNSSPEHFRNRLRHEALPALEAAAGRDVRDSLRRAAILAGEDEDYLSAAAAREGEALVSPETGALAVAGLRLLAPALVRRVVREWLRTRGVAEVDFELVEEALRVVRSSGRPATCNVTGGRRIRRRAGWLFLDRQDGSS